MKPSWRVNFWLCVHCSPLTHHKQQRPCTEESDELAHFCHWYEFSCERPQRQGEDWHSNLRCSSSSLAALICHVGGSSAIAWHLIILIILISSLHPRDPWLPELLMADTHLSICLRLSANYRMRSFGKAVRRSSAHYQARAAGRCLLLPSRSSVQQQSGEHLLSVFHVLPLLP